MQLHRSIADLTSRDKEADRTSAVVCKCVEFCIPPTFGLSYQTPTPPFFSPRLEAVQCAVR